MNTAILLSGGIGSRISSKIPKQYIRFSDYMMVNHALLPMLESPRIDEIYITAEAEGYERILEDIGKTDLRTSKISGCALPGETRQLSILSALEKIISRKGGISNISNTDTVLIHDAARPFLTCELIHECFAALPGHDGVMPVLPMKDTVYFSRNGRSVEYLLDRGSIYAGQAPELFLLKKYYNANIALLPNKIYNINGSTEPAVLAGMDIVMIPGDENNFKITTDKDLEKFKERVVKNGACTVAE